MKHTFKIICLVIMSLHLFCVLTAQAEERFISENQAKAAFIFKIAHYVSWSPPFGTTIVVGILGKGSLTREWQTLSGKTVNGNKLVVIKSNDIDEMLNCQIVFIEETNQTKLARILSVLRDYPIFTIGESPAFLRSGGMLNVSLLSNHITFSVNLSQARAAGLDVSSNLLKLASEVIK